MQTLIGTSYPDRNGGNDDDEDWIYVLNGFLCEEFLQVFDNVMDVKYALENTHRVYGPDGLGQHYVFRDGNGDSLVVEFLGKETLLHLDFDDSGVTGYGIFTNEPPL